MEANEQPDFETKTCHKFYKYLRFEDSLKVLTQGTLKYTRPTEFNDPFDCYPFLPERGWDKVYKRLNEQFGLEHKAPKKVLEKNLRDLRRTGKNGAIHRMVADKLAITCFSADPLSVPMWAHYADEHQGCVIEFQANNDIAKKIALETPDVMFVLPRFIVYTDERTPLYDKQGKIQGFDYIFTKSKQWSYEKEVRDFALKDGIHKFSRHQITKIYTGVRMNEANKRAIRETVSSMNDETGTRCKIVELGMAFNSYKFVELD